MDSGSSMTIIRIIPYPPSFSSTAARTIEPATGASTCAFGNQRWTPYNGIFTRKAIRHPAHQILWPQDSSARGCEYCKISIDRVPVDCCRRRRATRSGKDPARV